MSPLLKTSTLCSAVHLVFSVDHSCATSYFQGAVPCSLLPVHTTTTERFISCSCSCRTLSTEKNCISLKISLVNRTQELIKSRTPAYFIISFLGFMRILWLDHVLLYTNACGTDEILHFYAEFGTLSATSVIKLLCRNAENWASPKAVWRRAIGVIYHILLELLLLLSLRFLWN